MAELLQKEKKEPFNKFIKFYAEDVPFGSQEKTNTDAFIYVLQEDLACLKECKTTQDTAIKLRIIPTKFQSLILKSALNIKSYIYEIRTYLGLATSFINNNYISLSINNSRVKASLQTICANNKILTNGDFYEEILTFSPKDYARFFLKFLKKRRIHRNKWCFRYYNNRHSCKNNSENNEIKETTKK